MSLKLVVNQMQAPEFEVLSVVACRSLLQETLDMAIPAVMVEGEVSGFSVNKNMFVFFDIKDEQASLSCFMMRANLVQPIEDGMKVQIVARPTITAKGKLSLTIEAYKLVGEGSLARAFEMLKNKLANEGLFALERKRILPEFPTKIGLVASGSSAAYGDFIKIIDARWGGLKIIHCESSVQGVSAEKDIISAITKLNNLDDLPDVIVITRGGGSLEDLAAFNTESVARAVASSRVPTVVAVGHEQDISLADLVADLRASTPSNAAELLVPDKKQVFSNLNNTRSSLLKIINTQINQQVEVFQVRYLEIEKLVMGVLSLAEQNLKNSKNLLIALNPEAALKKGYAIIRGQQGIINSVKKLNKNDEITLKFYDGSASAIINKVQ